MKNLAIPFFAVTAVFASGVRAEKEEPQPLIHLHGFESTEENARIAAEHAAAARASPGFAAELERMKCLARDVPPFSLDRPDTDPANSYWLALANWLVYFPPEDVMPIIKQMGLKGATYIKKELHEATPDKIDWMMDGPLIPLKLGMKVSRKLKKELKKTISADTDAYLMVGDDYCLLVFRGTEAKGGIKRNSPLATDIKTDLQSYQMKFGDLGRVHMGFNGATSAAWEPIQKAIQNTGCKNIIVSGHSLGGADSDLFTTKSIYEESRNPGVLGYHSRSNITFGKPRVGNSDYEKAKERLIRLAECKASTDPSAPPACAAQHYQTERDIVPRVPTKEIQRYANSWRQKFYDKNGVGSKNDKDAYKKGKRTFWSALFHPKDWYHNHMLDFYSFRIAEDMDIDKSHCLPDERLKSVLGEKRYKDRAKSVGNLATLSTLDRSAFKDAIEELGKKALKSKAGKSNRWPLDTLWSLCKMVADPAACKNGLEPKTSYAEFRALGTTHESEKAFYANMENLILQDSNWTKLQHALQASVPERKTASAEQ